MAHILIVDDYEDIRDIWKALLELSGYQVNVAENGIEALKLIRKETFDLVIVDLFMPEMGGIELLGILSDEYPNLKLLAVTGGGEKTKANIDHFVESSKFAGAHSSLKKPIENEKFLNEIKRILATP